MGGQRVVAVVLGEPSRDTGRGTPTASRSGYLLIPRERFQNEKMR